MNLSLSHVTTKYIFHTSISGTDSGDALPKESWVKKRIHHVSASLNWFLAASESRLPVCGVFLGAVSLQRLPRVPCCSAVYQRLPPLWASRLISGLEVMIRGRRFWRMCRWSPPPCCCQTARIPKPQFDLSVKSLFMFSQYFWGPEQLVWTPDSFLWHRRGLECFFSCRCDL